MKEMCRTMCRIMMTRDEKMRELVEKHFKPEDYFNVRKHMIGTGMVGGKACGMLLSRAIVRNLEPEMDDILEPHDSFFVGSDVYYTYIVDNGFWDLRIRQRTSDEYFTLAEEFADHLKHGAFSADMKDRFRSILEYYGQDPYIVRSSSILEDGFDNAFAGKYESVFCANRGTMEERLQEFEDAIRTVYASTMSLSALDYRKRRGLDQKDEQMALLIQRVSGSYYGAYYMPCAAGVGYSFSPYRFLSDIDPSAGMLRLVMGLGTSAVDRTEGSYPRLVALNRPEATPSTTIAEKHQFSQKKIEAMDVKQHCLTRMELGKVEAHLPSYLKNILLEHDYEVESRLREQGIVRDIRFISCRGLVRNQKLMEQMGRILRLLEKEYHHPVDTEFTINLADDGEYCVNLLQCRPLQAFKDTGTARIPDDIPEDSIILETNGSSMGLSRSISIDRIVYIDPVSYYQMPYARKPEIADFIRKVNWSYRGKGKKMMLIAPGRIGTSSPELGVPTVFADISEFEVICELEEKTIGYNPELSYGSHFFQDLVEADILYAAVFSGESTRIWRPAMIGCFPDITAEFLEADGENPVENIVRVLNTEGKGCKLYHDLKQEKTILRCSPETDTSG